MKSEEERERRDGGLVRKIGEGREKGAQKTMRKKDMMTTFIVDKYPCVYAVGVCLMIQRYILPVTMKNLNGLMKH